MTAGFLLCLSKKRFAFGPESEESRRSELPIIETFPLSYLWRCASCRRVPLPDRAICRTTAAVIAGGEISRRWPLRRPDTPGKIPSLQRHRNTLQIKPLAKPSVKSRGKIAAAHRHFWHGNQGDPSYATCGKGFTEICGSFGFISLPTATHSNPSRFFSKLKRLRRVAIRYDTLASNFLAMVQLASRHLPLPIISQIILPLGLVVRPAARQLQIEVPILRKNLSILFLHISQDLFPNQAE